MMNERERFEKFTERARRVLSLAQEEAQRFNHNYIGTEHLLLGLVREGEGVGAQVLASLGVELGKVRDQVEFIIGRGDHIVLGEIGLTPRAKKVVELAVDEARRLNHHYIGTEHLLLGLVREGEGIAAGVLESLGLNLEKVRGTTIRLLAHKDVRSARDIFPAASTPTTPSPEPVGTFLFISYRPADASEATRLLEDQLAEAFGAERLIHHGDAAPLGTDVRVFLRGRIRQSDTLLVLIGPQWLAGAEDEEATGSDATDPVIIAIEAALRFHKRLVPVLLPGATMPRAAQLPSAIRDMVYHQGMTLRPAPDLEGDVAQLIAALGQLPPLA